MKRFISGVICVVLSAVIIITSSFTAFADEWRYGVDVSHNNGAVNFTDIKNEGKSFAMIRLGYYNHLDRCFWDNVKSACADDIDFGVYLYSYAESVEEAKIEAYFVLETLSQLGDYAKNFTLPVAYDLEDKKVAPYGKYQITQQMTTFLDIIKSAGYTPMVYANANWFDNYIDINVAKQYKLWYAAYGKGTPDTAGRVQISNTGIYADMWQYADGGDNGLDQNVIYNSADIMKSLSCYHSYAMTEIAPSCNIDGAQQWCCSKCGNMFSLPIPKTAHDVVTDNAVDATYFSNGKTMGRHCSICGEIIVAQTNVTKKKPAIKKMTAKKKSLSVSWGKVSSANGYEIQYSTSKSFTKMATVTKNIKNSKTVSMTASKLKSGKKYYVRIRAYKNNNGKKVYTSWSTTKNVKVK